MPLVGKSETQKIVNSSIKAKKDDFLFRFSNEVLKSMQKDGVTPTPHNYGIYFEKVLETKSLKVQKEIRSLLACETVIDLEEYVIKLEKYTKDGFKEIKKLLSLITKIYKLVNSIVVKVEKLKNNLKNATNLVMVQNLIDEFNTKSKSISDTILKESGNIKKIYSSIFQKLNFIETNSIFNTELGVFNRSYILNQVNLLQKKVEEQKIEVSLILLNIKDTTFREIESLNDEKVVVKTVAKTLLKSSRRSDIVGHLEDKKFLIALLYTNLENAKKAAERLREIVENINLFLGGNEIEIDVELVVAKLDSKIYYEELILKMIELLPQSGKGLREFVIFGEEDD